MNNRQKYGLPAPHQGTNRYGHPDSYTGVPGPVSQPPARYQYGNSTYGGGMATSQQTYRGYHPYQRHTHHGYASAPMGYYGNPIEIRVSDPNWVDALLEAMRQGQEVDLIFDLPNIVDQLVDAVVEQVGSFTDIVARHAERAIDEFFAAGMAYPNPNVPSQAMIAPVVAVALIAAILVVALAIIYAIVSIYNANASREIAEIAVNRGCEVVDIETTSSGSGSGGNGGGWFDFLNGSKWMIRCSGQ